MYKSFSLLLLMVICAVGPHLQAQSDSVTYKPGFKFQDGIYLNFNEFKTNSPSITNYSVVTQSGKKWFKATDTEKIRTITYFDEFGTAKSLHLGGFWGACADGQPYAYADGQFNKLEKIGYIIYLVVYSTENITERTYSYTGQYQEKTTGTENVEYKYLIDFRTGQDYEFMISNFQLLLEADPELYDEFKGLKGRNMKEHQMLNYIDKFNERHPIKLPVNPFYQFE